MRYDLAELRRSLKPFRLHWYPTVGSTNTKAAQLRRGGKLFAPACVLTGRQTSGRGRGTNLWHAPRGVMTVTFAIPTSESVLPHHVPLIAGLAVRNACAELGAPGVGLKWPNDLWHDDLKLAGLLCERIDHVDLVGVGLNVNVDPRKLPAGLRGKATTLAALTAQPLGLTHVLLTVARHLSQLLLKHEQAPSTLLQTYSKHLVLTGRRIRIVDGTDVIEGQCEGIDRVGRLLVAVPSSGRRAFTSGNVSLATA
ncbi:MAG: biotin--[acetyl-CoA-carboxylase] ligase [Tepidisphaeraceae bacterium]